MERSEVVEEPCVEETVREREEDVQGGDVEDREQQEGEAESVRSVGRSEDPEETSERPESEDEESDGARRRSRSGAKRARNAATFTDEQEMQIIDFVKDHPELYAKEHMHYVDKSRKDGLWRDVGKLVGRSGDDCRRWFTTQRTRYGKLTAAGCKSGSGTAKKYQMTERTKWVLREFQFMGPHILRKASTETAGFPSMSSVALTSPPHDDSRGSGQATDVESMDTSGHPISQQPSFSAVSTSTPAQSQSQDPAFTEMYRQTQGLLSEFLKDKQSQEQNARRPFFDFVMSETGHFPDSLYHQFKADVFQLVQRYQLRLQSQPSQPSVRQPPRQPLPTRSATVTSESQIEGVLPPVSVTRATTQATTTTASSTVSQSLSQTQFCAPSPISFGNPPSVSNWLGNDDLNMSAYLLTPETTQVTVQPQQQLQQVTLQTQPSTSQQPQFALVQQQPQPLQPQQYTVVQAQPSQQQPSLSSSTTPSPQQPGPPPQ